MSPQELGLLLVLGGCALGILVIFGFAWLVTRR